MLAGLACTLPLAAASVLIYAALSNEQISRVGALEDSARCEVHPGSWMNGMWTAARLCCQRSASFHVKHLRLGSLPATIRVAPLWRVVSLEREGSIGRGWCCSGHVLSAQRTRGALRSSGRGTARNLWEKGFPSPPGRPLGKRAGAEPRRRGRISGLERALRPVNGKSSVLAVESEYL